MRHAKPTLEPSESDCIDFELRLWSVNLSSSKSSRSCDYLVLDTPVTGLGVNVKTSAESVISWSPPATSGAAAHWAKWTPLEVYSTWSEQLPEGLTCSRPGVYFARSLFTQYGRAKRADYWVLDTPVTGLGVNVLTSAEPVISCIQVDFMSSGYECSAGMSWNEVMLYTYRHPCHRTCCQCFDFSWTCHKLKSTCDKRRSRTWG